MAEAGDGSKMDEGTYMWTLPSDPKGINKVQLLPKAEFKTAEELIEKAALVKKPAEQTGIAQKDCLSDFIQHAELKLPTFGTKDQLPPLLGTLTPLHPDHFNREGA